MNITNIQHVGVNIMAGAVPEYEDIDTSGKVIVFKGMTLVGIITLIVMGAIGFYNKCYDAFILDYSFAAILLLNFLNLKKNKNYSMASMTGIGLLGLLLFYLLITGGDQGTGHLMFLTFPLFSYFLLGSKKGTYATLFMFLPTFAFLIFNPFLPNVTIYSTNFSIRFLISYLVVSAFSYLLEATRKKIHDKLISKNNELNIVIEELKKAEQNLREAGEKLELRVEERTKELSRANEDLRREIEDRKQAEEARKLIERQLIQAQKMEALGTLAGGVAHDLNNILAGLVGYPDLIRSELSDDSPLIKSILTIKKSGEKAAAIVEDLLTLSRRGVAAKEVLMLPDIISEYLESPEFEKLKVYHPGIKVEVSIEKDTAPIEGSSIHLFKTIMNLVSNAAEAMPRGGEIRISSKTRRIEERNKDHLELPKGEYVVLRVSDTGEGIEREDIERIFEPFFTKKVMGRSGTGLGMAVVWGTVKDHEGYIDVQSKVGKGTTFSLYFPVSSKRLSGKDSKDGVSDMEWLQGKGESILIVDDVEEQREVASVILGKLGYRVESVPNGEEAVDRVQSHDFDLILLDMIMDPGMDGLDTFKKIKGIKSGQKAIITSGYAETGRVRECLNLGAGLYVKKPFTMEEIGRAVREALS